MDEERPSLTAEGAAEMRALHQTIDGEPKILDDPISVRLVDPQSDSYWSRVERLERMPEPSRLRFKATFVMRSRFGEDRLAESVVNGVRQYVLLGARLDSGRNGQGLDNLKELEEAGAFNNRSLVFIACDNH